MFTIINIIIIIICCVRGCKMTPNSFVLCLSQIQVKIDIQWYKIVLHAPDSESTLFYDVHLVFTIQAQVSSFPPAKLSDEHPLQKHCYRISITSLDVWCCQKKKLTWNHTYWCKLQSLLKFNTFKNAWKFQLRNMQFQQTKII